MAVIATPGTPPAALAAKAATTTIPIVFGVGEDPVKLGLVTSLARPGGNATGINFFVQEVTSKRLALLHELVPKAARIAVLVNPANAPTTETTLREAQEAARALGLQIHVLNASTIGEIDAAFATLARERADALLIAGDRILQQPPRPICHAGGARPDADELCQPRDGRSRPADELRDQHSRTCFVRSASIPATFSRARKPADLPVLQTTKFEFVINLQTAKALGLEVPNSAQLLADEVIE